MTASLPAASSSRPTADDLSVAAQLHRRCDSWVQHYREDLEHDRRALAEVPEETPFVCVARRCGTDLLILRQPTDPFFPPIGQRVPFLFGEAGREKLADAVLTILEFNQAEHEQEERRWFAHWGEGVVWSVEPEEALRKAKAWRDRLGRAWDRDRASPTGHGTHVVAQRLRRGSGLRPDTPRRCSRVHGRRRSLRRGGCTNPCSALTLQPPGTQLDSKPAAIVP